MDVVGNGDGVKSAFDIERIDGGGKLIVDGAEVEAPGRVGGAVFFDQAGGGAAARKTNVIEQRLLGARDVRHLVERHAQLVVGAAGIDLEVASAHAHDVGKRQASPQFRPENAAEPKPRQCCQR